MYYMNCEINEQNSGYIFTVNTVGSLTVEGQTAEEDSIPDDVSSRTGSSSSWRSACRNHHRGNHAF